MQWVVLLTCDTDCDGTTFGAHKIHIPDGVDPAQEGAMGILKHAHATDQLSSYYDIVDEVLPLDTFLCQYPMSPEDTDRFHRLNYTSRHRNPVWNPWAGPDGDDTIGIPALDSRYDD